MRLLNLGLMRRWENWATILLMVVIGVIAVNSLCALRTQSER